MPKIVPKSIQTCFERVLGQTFRKIFAQFSTAGLVLESFQKNQKTFKIPKTPKIVPKRIQTCFRVVFSKKFYAQCSMEARDFEKFQIFFSKFQKCPKSFPKVSKSVLNVFWGKFFEKFFCPVFRGGSSFRKFSKKTFSKFQKSPKSFPKESKRVLNMFWGKFFEQFFCPVFRGESRLRNFSKKFKKCENSK